MKKILLSFIAVLLPLMASADPVEIGGIYYNLVKKAKAAQVTSNPTPYSGSVVIPSSVTDVDGTTYSVTSIGSSAFQGCSGLTSISIPSTVTTIDGGAFSNCTGLTSITIPNSVKSFGNYAFSGCSNLTSVNITDLAAWCKISFGDNPLNYAHHLYLSGVEVKNLVIPSGVTSISDGAFKGCSGLTSVSIPSSVTSIGGGAFSGCSGMTSITIPNSVTSIGEGAFSGSGLTSITILNGVTEIGNGAFSNCSSLATVILPNSMTSIDSYLFYNCSSLTSVTMGNSVYTIGENAFYGCSSLTSIDIPNTVSEIGQYAFTGSGLTAFTIPNSMTSIGSFVFSGCSSLTSVTIPNSISKICDQAFYLCNNLTSVHITDLEAWCNIDFEIGLASNPLSLAHHLYLNGTEIVDLVSSVGLIKDYAFAGCTSLHTVTLPNIWEIGIDAFASCSNITTITLGENCTIYTGAFSSCSELTDVYCYATNVPSMLLKEANWENPSDPSTLYYRYEPCEDAFNGCGIEFATLHVPAESIEAYEAVEPWKSFMTILPISTTTPSSNIVFADGNVKTLCVANWDTGGDGELSLAEAAAVTNLGTVFTGNTSITSFDELQYFTGLSTINGDPIISFPNSAFSGCTSLTSVTIPNSVTSIGECAFYACI